MIEKTVKTLYSDVLSQSEREEWKETPIVCPKCFSGAVIYGNETSDGNRYEHCWCCSCSWCDAEWFELF